MASSTTSGTQKSVLIVDDDEFSRAILRKKLARLGVTDIQEAMDGRAGVRALAQMAKPPDFLICDIFMPDMDGIEFVAELSKRNYPGGLILVTGVNRNMLEVAAEIASLSNLNVVGTFTKPVMHEALQKALGMT